MTVPHSWINKNIVMLRLAEDMEKRFNESIKHWNTELNGCKQRFWKGNTECRMFQGDIQGDTFSLLLFALTVTQFSLILRKAKISYDL